MNKCPSCGKAIIYVDLQDIEINAQSPNRWRGISYCCPLCRAVLGVSIDPVALKADMIAGVTEAVKKLLGR